MKRLATLLLSLLSALAFAQEPRDVKEQVYLHLSSADLIVGETLHFSAFVRSQASGKLSDLSKLLYVEILDAERSPVYQTKLTLKEGRGAGKYFLPSLMKTGTYHLTAYTRWMRNWGDYFHTSLHIINPYEEVEDIVGDEALSVQFFPDGGQLTPDVENVLRFVASRGGQPQQITGRLVSDQDEGATPIKTRTSGIGQVSFTPRTGRSYRFIIEGDTGFEFIDLPAACADCVGMTRNEENGTQVFQLQGATPLNSSSLQLLIHNHQSVAMKQSWDGTGPLYVPSSSLPDGLLRALLVNGTDTLSQQVFWSGTLPSAEWASQTSSNTASLREAIEKTYSLPAGAQVSVAIQRVDGSYLSTENLTQAQATSALEKILDPRQIEADEYLDLLAMSKWNPSLVGEEVLLLPEYRSDLLQGYVTNQNNEIEADVSIGLSVPSRPYQLRLQPSGADGSFLLDYNSDITGEVSVLNVFENNNQRSLDTLSQPSVEKRIPANTSSTSIDIDDRFRLHILDEYYARYPDHLLAAPLQFDTLRLKDVIQRSIYNQIDNAYFEEQPDTIFIGLPQVYGFDRYTLDDFTRFQTMRDTFIEIIPTVGVSKNEKNFRLNLRTTTDYEHRKAGGESILMIDGVLVTSEAILTMSPFLVQHIDVLNKKYFFGSKMFDGIISVHTFGGDAWEGPSKSRQLKLTPVQGQALSEESPGPSVMQEADYRTLLSWQPLRTVPEDGQLAISFRTSDVSGKYLIDIEGVSADGTPITVQEVLLVQDQRPSN